MRHALIKILFQHPSLNRSASLNANASEFAPSAASTPCGPTLRQSMSVDGGAGDPQRKESPMTIKVGGETIRIACNNEEMAKTCKRALDMYFAEKSVDSSSGKSTTDDESTAEDPGNIAATTAAKSLVAIMCLPLAGSHSIRNAGILLPKKLHELTELLSKT